MKLFGKKKDAPVKSVNDAIQELNGVLETFDKKEAFLSKQCVELTREAAALVKAGNRPKAIFVLRKRKLVEKRIDHIGNQRMNIETQKNALIQAADNKNLIAVMKSSNAALKREEVDIDDVEQVADLAQEQIAQISEVSDALARPIGEVVDEDELMRELMELDQPVDRQVDRTVDRTVDPVIDDKSFPSVPSKQTVQDLDEELKALDRLMLS